MTVSHATKRRWNAAPAPSNAETGNWSLYSLPWGRSNPTYCYYEQRRRIWFCAQLLDAKWKPDFGPAEYIPNWGASVVGARKFLIAYNVNLLSTKEQAHRIALDIREQGRGPEQVRQPQTPLTELTAFTRSCSSTKGVVWRGVGLKKGRGGNEPRKKGRGGGNRYRERGRRRGRKQVEKG